MTENELASWAAHYNEKSWRERIVDAEKRGA